MSKTSRRTTAAWPIPGGALLLALSVAVSGCATLGGAKAEDVVRKRATQRAEAFAKGDYDTSYALLTPSFRKLRDLPTYRGSIGATAKWEKAEVSNVACQEQRCIVGLKVSVKPLIPGRFNDTITVQFEETWLLEDGTWWLHQAL